MKPSELRIGNLVYGISGGEIKLPVPIPLTICQIEVFNVLAAIGNPFDPCSDTPWNRLGYNDISPIPLDAEWYKRCNFYRVDHVHGYSFYTFNRKDKANRGLVDLDINENSTTTGGRTINHIKYLHQLQNVFYALNGIEMPITHTELTKKEI